MKFLQMFFGRASKLFFGEPQTEFQDVLDKVVESLEDHKEEKSYASHWSLLSEAAALDQKESFRDVFARPELGSTRVRFMPPTDEDQAVFYVRSQHYIKTDAFRQFQCLAKMGQVEGCPLCERYVETSDQKYKPVKRYYANAVIGGEVKIFTCGESLFKQIASHFQRDPDLLEASLQADLIIEKSSGRFLSYDVTRGSNSLISHELLEKRRNVEETVLSFGNSKEEMKTAL